MAYGTEQNDSDPPDPSRWDITIRRFEAEDAGGRVPQGRILFVGSSSITRWDLPRYFARDDLINRGFGGSLLAEVAELCERYVIAPRPRQIVLYAGDNDLAFGRTAGQVLEAYLQFVTKVRAALPHVPILFVSIKPSPSRRALMDTMREANALIEAETQDDAAAEYLDVFAPMLAGDGEPRPELFVDDRLHLSHEGYLLWAELIGPWLK